MKILEEEKEIIATLLVQGKEYPVLDLHPAKRNEIPFILREHTHQFLVIVEGFAQPIIVGRNSFVILPLLETYTETVRYFVEDEEEAQAQIILESQEKILNFSIK